MKKIYIVERSNFSFGMTSYPEIAFLEEIDALVYADMKNKDRGDRMFGSSNHFSVKSLPLDDLPVKNEKAVKKFATEKIKEIDDEMIKNSESQDKTHRSLVEANEELALRKSQLQKYV